MAAPITHIVLSEKVFDIFLKNTDKREFIIGTSFPDIRYLGVIDRSKTHLIKDQFKTITGESSFNKGLIFHSIIDYVRESLVEEKNLYSYLPRSQYITHSLKLFEDQTLYPVISDWNIFGQYFDNILDEEIEYDIPKSDLSVWHNILKEYLMVQPDRESIQSFVESIKFDTSAVAEILSNMDYMKNNKPVISYINELYRNVENRIGALGIF